MKLCQMNFGQRIAQAVHDFEKQRNLHEREWVTFFLNEETIVIAVLGSLTDSERAIAGTPVGLTRISEFLQWRFGNTDLPRKIESLSGMKVHQTKIEVDPTTGSVVLLFTTETAGRMSRRLSTALPSPIRLNGSRLSGPKAVSAPPPKQPNVFVRV